MAIIRKFMAANMHGVEITDEEKLYGQLDLGQCEGKKIYGVVDENGSHLEFGEG